MVPSKPKVEMECLYCHSKFLAFPSHVHRRKFCSHSCRALATIASGKNPGFSRHNSHPLREATDPYFYPWLAGFIDGDGSIFQPTKNRKYRWWVVSASGAVPDVNPAMDYIRDQIGGGMWVRPPYKTTFAVRAQMVWQVARQGDVKWLLRRLLPYLTIKKSKAEQALQELHA